ncbi:hypothetical protein D9M69_317830 [compost metagenome]
MADQVGQRQGQGQADQEALAAGQRAAVAGDVGLPGVDHLQFQLAAAAPRQLVAAVQALQLAVGEVDQVIEGQALGELAVLGAIGRADQPVEALPQVVLAALPFDLGEQRLLVLPALVVALQLRADFALALADLAQLLAQCHPLALQLCAVADRRRCGAQLPFFGLGGLQQGLGLSAGLVQTPAQFRERRALLVVEQRGEEPRCVGERAGRQRLCPGEFGAAQLLALALGLLLQGQLAAMQGLDALFGGEQIGLGPAQLGGGVIERRRRALGQSPLGPTLLPAHRDLSGSRQFGGAGAALRLQFALAAFVTLPGLPLGVTGLQPGVLVVRQGMAEFGQGGGELRAVALPLGLPLGLAFTKFGLLPLAVVALLTEQGQLPIPFGAGLLARLATLAGGLQRGAGLFQRGELFLQGAQLGAMALEQRRQVERLGRQRQVHAEALPLCILLVALLLEPFPLLLQLVLLGGQRSQGVAHRLALLAHLLQFRAQGLQALLGVRNVEGLVAGDGRMLVGTAQRAGLAGLQLRAVGLEGLDAALLFEQLFLVGDARAQSAEALEQVLPTRLVLALAIRQFDAAGIQARELGGQLAALALQVLQLRQPTATLVQMLPALAQAGFALSGKQLPVVVLPGGLVVARLHQRCLGAVQSALLFGDLRGQALDLGVATLPLRRQLLDFRLHLATPVELRAPGDQPLAEPSLLRLRGLPGGDVAELALQGVVPGLAVGSELAAGQARQLQVVLHLALGLATLGGEPDQGLLDVHLGLVGALPVGMRPAQTLGRLAGIQSRQLRLGLLLFATRRVQPLRRRLTLGLHPRQGFMPLTLDLQRLLTPVQRAFLASQLGRLGLQRTPLFVVEQFDALGTRAQLIQRALHLAGTLEHPLRDQPVDFAAGQLFQQFGALVGAGFEEGGEAALGEQHGFGEALEVEAGERFGLLELVVDLVGEDFSVGAGQFDLRCL